MLLFSKLVGDRAQESIVSQNWLFLKYVALLGNQGHETTNNFLIYYVCT